MRQRFILLVLCLCMSLCMSAKKTRVACVGNSITYGAFISDREQNSYPAQLQKLLGGDYEVRNFGLSGCTVLEKGNMPYVESSEYEESLEFNPDIVLFKMGTNDSKAFNWKYSSEFKSNYLSLIKSYMKLPSEPRIILLTPLRCFLSEDKGSINNTLIEKGIIPLIEEIAYEEELELVNLHNMFGNEWNSSLLPDKIHPSSMGAEKIAKKIYRYLIVSEKKSDTISDFQFKGMQCSNFNFHGFNGAEFTSDGLQYLVVKPKFVAKGHPWVLRARFWGHEPQTDIELLENGFYVAYCDVADMYGSDKAIKRWDKFYNKMIKAGMARRVVLEGMSRGGLIVYNWAARNPEKVACIYADAPVLDIKSWPMGEGKSEGSASDTNKMMKAYGFSKKKDALEWKNNPLDHCKIMVEYKIPILHVVGDSDDVVPVYENTAIFEKKISDFGGKIQVIHKSGIGHHPHSLYNPERIVSFILTNTIL